jgi:hypothetical protein
MGSLQVGQVRKIEVGRIAVELLGRGLFEAVVLGSFAALWFEKGVGFKVQGSGFGIRN